MIQKVIKVGNSFAVTIPKGFADDLKWHSGQEVQVEEDRLAEAIIIQAKNNKRPKTTLTPEFKAWLDAFTEEHKEVLEELAKR